MFVEGLPLRLRRFADEELVERLDGLHPGRILNPSSLVDGTNRHVVFSGYTSVPRRRQRPDVSTYWATLTSRHVRTAASTPVDLSALMLEEWGIERVADPKLLTLDGQVHVTFNTGAYRHSPNALYLVQLTPQVGPPLRCELDGRQRVEKNWTFFRRRGELVALYGLRPLIYLRLATRSADVLVFEPESRSSLEGPVDRGLTIGTQALDDGASLTLVAHEKRFWRGRRLYVGRAASLDAETTGAGGSQLPRRLSLGSRRLVHSLASTVPVEANRRLNPRLLSATYFSSLRHDPDGEHVELGYGINDRAFNFVRIARSSLF